MPVSDSFWEPLNRLGEHLPAWAQIAILGLVVVLFAAGWIANHLNPILDFVERVRGPKEPTATADEEIKISIRKENFWLRTRPAAIVPPLASSIPIITIANMKGGVGKTTTTANLAAYFERKKNLPVLLIDFDYQGSLSLSTIAVTGVGRAVSGADELITPGYNPETLMAMSQSLNNPADPSQGLSRSRVFTADYDLANTELELLVEWCAKPNTDVRYQLSNFLRSEIVQKEFGIVLIDAPPRFTTATINALCASTHVLIPTILDMMSAEAVVYFSHELVSMRGSLFPQLKFLGVVPSMIAQDPPDASQPRLSDNEKRCVSRIDAALMPLWGMRNSMLISGRIPDRADFAKFAG